MTPHAIGLVELNSIAKGFEVCDAMAKTAEVTVLTAKSICPGKYIVMIGGDVAAVGDERRSQPEHGSGIVSARIVVRDRAADRAHMAHLRMRDSPRHVR